MKSQIHKHQENNFLSVSKKVVLLALLVLGTGAFASVRPIAVKGIATKEITVRKHRKAIKKVKKLGAIKAETPKAATPKAKK